MPVMTTGDAIAESLIAHGVDTVFGIPGAHTYDLIDALARRGTQLRFIATRHEQGAAYMAYGYAKATGRTGVFTVVPGPGVLNAGAALCTAYGATTPLLCLTGNIQAHLIGQGRGQLHELPDQLALLRGLTKWSERINHPTEAGAVMAEAFRQLRSGRVRPVAVETPWNVFGMSAEVRPVAPAPAPGSAAARPRGSRCRGQARRRRPPTAHHGRRGRARCGRAGAGTGAAPAGARHRASQRQGHRRRGPALTACRPSRPGNTGATATCCSASAAASSFSTCAGAGFRSRCAWCASTSIPTEMVRLRPEVGLVTDSCSARARSSRPCGRWSARAPRAPRNSKR